MKRKRFSEEQIAFALRQAESGTTIEEKAQGDLPAALQPYRNSLAIAERLAEAAPECRLAARSVDGLQ